MQLETLPVNNQRVKAEEILIQQLIKEDKTDE